MEGISVIQRERVRDLPGYRQMVQIRQNASGVVSGLTIEGGDGQQVLFTRQPDGTFLRVK
jgi:cell envelope opacity-associated protein A